MLDPEEDVKKKTARRILALLDDCKEFLGIYNKLQLNEALTKQLVAESNSLLEMLTTFLDLVDDSEDLEDLGREMHRWNVRLSSLENFETN